MITDFENIPQLPTIFGPATQVAYVLAILLSARGFQEYWTPNCRRLMCLPWLQ
jgi:hypothetical protein